MKICLKAVIFMSFICVTINILHKVFYLTNNKFCISKTGSYIPRTHILNTQIFKILVLFQINRKNLNIQSFFTCPNNYYILLTH